MSFLLQRSTGKFQHQSLRFYLNVHHCSGLLQQLKIWMELYFLVAIDGCKFWEVVADRGIGMGVIFVHKLTETDINHNGLRIPKEIVKALNIAKRGWAILAMGEENHWFDASYYTTTDGRLGFKSGWDVFASNFGMDVGNVVLILFHMGTDGYLKIFFDVL